MGIVFWLENVLAEYNRQLEREREGPTLSFQTQTSFLLSCILTQRVFSEEQVNEAWQKVKKGKKERKESQKQKRPSPLFF